MCLSKQNPRACPGSINKSLAERRHTAAVMIGRLGGLKSGVMKTPALQAARSRNIRKAISVLAAKRAKEKQERMAREKQLESPGVPRPDTQKPTVWFSP